MFTKAQKNKIFVKNSILERLLSEACKIERGGLCKTKEDHLILFKLSDMSDENGIIYTENKMLPTITVNKDEHLLFLDVAYFQAKHTHVIRFLYKKTILCWFFKKGFSVKHLNKVFYDRK